MDGGYLIPVTERDVGQLGRACVLQVGHVPIKRRSFKRRVLRVELLRTSRIVVGGEWRENRSYGRAAAYLLLEHVIDCTAQ